MNIVKSIKDEAMRELDELGKEVFANLLPNEPTNFIPEDIFRDYFLPRLLGIERDDSPWARNWIGIAGSPMAEVGILGIGGEHLFNVPPFFNTGGIIDPTGQGSLNDIFVRYEQYKLNSPMMGLNFLSQELGKRGAQYQSGVDQTYINRWADIARRYGLYPGGEQTHISESSQAEDLFDYD